MGKKQRLHPRGWLARKRSRLARKVRNQFLEGILVTVPIGATILILVWIFSTVDKLLQPLIKSISGHTIPGIGFIATIVLIYLAGVITDNFLGKVLIRYGETLLAKIPVVRHLYSGAKQILQSFATLKRKKTGFMQVVLVEFPRKGMKAIGFITNEITDKSGEKYLSVLIPTAPNPTTGFLQILKEEEVIRTQMSVDEAIKMIISVGKIAPDTEGKLSLGD